ncbi:MAG TPA: hypothetical protein VF179_11690 [Thermoanaerobaculia bacterium]|nr:hypothetical protein [Thermoanaerobaculia bacterium]
MKVHREALDTIAKLGEQVATASDNVRAAGESLAKMDPLATKELYADTKNLRELTLALKDQVARLSDTAGLIPVSRDDRLRLEITSITGAIRLSVWLDENTNDPIVPGHTYWGSEVTRSSDLLKMDFDVTAEAKELCSLWSVNRDPNVCNKKKGDLSGPICHRISAQKRCAAKCINPDKLRNAAQPGGCRRTRTFASLRSTPLSRIPFGAEDTLAHQRPTIFIGSSTEGLQVAEAIYLNLDRSCETEIWSQGALVSKIAWNLDIGSTIVHDKCPLHPHRSIGRLEDAAAQIKARGMQGRWQSDEVYPLCPCKVFRREGVSPRRIMRTVLLC